MWTCDDDDLARGDVLKVNPPDGQQVTRLDSGQHARTRDAESDRSERAHDFRRQLDSEGVPRIGRRVHQRQAASYDFFRLEWQGPPVPLILPQASAIVSKTRSDRKVGFW